MKSFKKLENEIAALEKRVGQEKARLQSADEKITELKGKLKAVLDRLPALTFEGPELDLKAVEKERDNLRAEIERTQNLIHGIQNFLSSAGKELAEKGAERETLFAELTAAWLREETVKFDAAARLLARHQRRLLAANLLLREISRGEVFGQVLGPAYEFLPGVKIPVLEGFNVTDFRSNPRGRASMEDIRTVKAEIQGGGGK